jgi:hypothetical protein
MAASITDDVRELKAEVRKLRARVATLEAAQAVRPKRRTAPRRGYVDIPQAASDARWNVWTGYSHLKFLETCGAVYNRQRGDLLPTSKAWFAANVRDEAGNRFNLRELERWFSRRNTFPANSRQDLRIRRAIERETDRLRAAGYFIGMPLLDAQRLHTTVM